MTTIKLSTYDVRANVTPDDLHKYRHLVPATGLEILGALGDVDGLMVLNVLGGVQTSIPRGPCTRQGHSAWNMLAAMIGTPIMQKLANQFGGTAITIPMMQQLRLVRRNHGIIAEHERLTAKPEAGGEGLMHTIAVTQLTLTERLTFREITNILNDPNMVYEEKTLPLDFDDVPF